jgi:hypothetical protein
MYIFTKSCLPKWTVFTILFLAITSAGAYAQSIHWGVKAGTNIFNLGGRSFDGKFHFGYSAGGFAEINLNSQWGIQPELLINQTMATTQDNFNSIYHGISPQNVSLNYITIPVLLTFRPVKEFSIQAGPQYGYMIYQTKDLVQYQRESFKKNDISIVFGGQFNLNKVKLGARYVIGLNDINALPGGADPWKNQGFQLFAGFRIL